MGINCKVRNVFWFLTVLVSETFCELSVHAGNYVTRGYSETKFTIRYCRIHLKEPVRFSETSEHQTTTWCRYTKNIIIWSSASTRTWKHKSGHTSTYYEFNSYCLEIRIFFALRWQSVSDLVPFYLLAVSVDFPLVLALHIHIDVVNQFMSLLKFYWRS